MKLALLVLVAACRASADDYPIGPGAEGSGQSGGGDAGTSDARDAAEGDAGVQITGRVCLVTDLRNPTACADNQVVRNITVSIGTTRTAIPNQRGDFTISAPLGPFTWRVTGRDVITSVVPFGADTRLPVISDVLYTELLSANDVTRTDLQTSVVVRVVNGVMAVANVRAASVPATPDLARYDDEDSLLDWRSDQLGTGPAGVAWLPDIPLASDTSIAATVNLTPPVGTAVSTQVPVENQAITFVTTEL
jgi:hypothetical protein